MLGIAKTLKIGAVVFGASAIFLLLAPSLFLELLNLNSTDSSLVWSMRMIAITLVALAGNMWQNSKSDSDRLRQVGSIMAISAAALGVLTLLIPVEWTWFTITYASVGFLFGINYIICLIRKTY